MKFPSKMTAVLALALSLCLCGPMCAEVLVNWEGGFEVEVPDFWLRRDLQDQGLKLNADDVHMQVETYSGLSQMAQVARLHQETKDAGYHFRSERSFPINQVPAHEMIFFKDGAYKIYYVLMAGQRGFLWTVTSPSTDSEAFMEGQDIIYSFQVKPI